MSYQFSGNRSLLQTFGESVLFTPAGQDELNVQMIEVTPASLPEGVDPAISVVYWAVAADFPAAPKAGDSIGVGSDQYLITQVRREVGGGGGLYLIASR